MHDLMHTVATCFEQVAFFYAGGDPKNQASFENRAKYLDQRTYEREKLADVLENYHRGLGAGPRTLEQIAWLRQPDCLVVITGQQAGFLTGPAYTLYKALTTIKLAAEQSIKLKRPVVPVFWIASEDHDWVEIQEAMILNQEGKLIACYLPGEGNGIPVGRLGVPAWEEIVRQIDEALPVSEFKAEILQTLEELTDQATNLTEWFALILQWLIHDRGLIFFDPLQPEIKKLALPMYQSILRSHQEVREAFQSRTKCWVELGYTPQIQQSGEEVNLFWEVPERKALLWDENGFYPRGSSGRLALEELNSKLQESPEQFSSNVVTRPVVQDYLLPTLAYVPGPGELNYWAQLGGVFAVLGFSMPILYPRLSAVVITGSWQRVMEAEQITVSDVSRGLELQRERCLVEHDQYDIEQRFTQARSMLELLYQDLMILEGINPHVPEWIAQNQEKVNGQLAYLEKKIWQAQRKRCDGRLRKFQQLEDGLYPRGIKQERVLNPLSFLARFGWTFIDQLAELPLEFEEQELVMER